MLQDVADDDLALVRQRQQPGRDVQAVADRREAGVPERLLTIDPDLAERERAFARVEEAR